MVTPAPLTHEAVNLINEDDRRLELPRQAEERMDELVGLAEPLVRERRDVQVDECRAGLFRECLGEQSLSAPGRAV